MIKRLLLIMTVIGVGISGLFCGNTVTSYAEKSAFVSKDTGLDGNEQPFKGMECEQDLYYIHRTYDGKAAYYQWLTPFDDDGGRDERLYLAINTLDGSENKKTRTVKSKAFKEIDNPGFNITRQDKKGNVYEIHNTKKEAKGFWSKKRKPMNSYLCMYDKKGNRKIRFKVAKYSWESNYSISDMYIKSGKVYIAFNYYMKSEPMRIKVYNIKTGKKIKQVKLTGQSGSYSEAKIKYTGSGLYVLSDDRVERYSLDGSKLKNTYMLPDNNKWVALTNGVMQICNNPNAYESDLYTLFEKECFSVTDSYVYYINADGLYRADIKGGSGFELIFNASGDAYFTGGYTISDMVCIDDDTFYTVVQEGPDEPHLPTHIIKYSR